MTRTRPPQLAFSSGEISPLLHARSDYQRYQSGLRSCNGFLPLRQGGITRAPGTIFRGYTRGNARARLVDFEFAENDALTLEFTPGKMRVWRYGALVETAPGVAYELDTPYLGPALRRLQWVQSADVIYLADGRRPIQKLSRFALDNWTLEPAAYDAGPFRVQNLDKDKTVQCSVESAGMVDITATGGFLDASWVGVLMRIEPTDFSDIPLWTGNTAVSVGDLMRYGTNIYRLTAGTDTGVNVPIHTEGEQLVDKTKGTKWEFVSGYDGIVRIATVADANTATAEVLKPIPEPCITSPTYRWSEGAWSERRGYPRSVDIHDQSFFAAFTPDEPRTVWASTLGDFSDFQPSAEADGSFAYTIAGSTSQNSGNWIRAARRGIYIGALGEVYRGFSNATGQRIGPTTFDTDLEATDGCNSARPIAPYGYPVFVTKDGQRVQEIRYSFEEDGGSPVELSLPGQHLGAERFSEIVWQSAPQRLAWLRRGNDELAVMLYDPAEEVLGWARCSLAGGAVEAMAVTTDGETGNDILTMVVRREIDGQTVRMIEEQAVIFGVIAGNRPIHEAVHFFASAVFRPDPATDSFDVPHLAGEDVYVWTDRGEFGPITVPAGGNITIAQKVNHAVIGLFDATHVAETLNIAAQAPDGSSTGRYRRLQSGGGLIMHKTAAGYVRAVERNFGQPDEVGDRHEIVPLQVATDLVQAFSGVAEIDVPSGHASEVSYRFEPYGGAPMTIAGLVPNIEEVGA